MERDQRLWLRLRIDGRAFYAANEGVDPGHPDDSLGTAALAVLSATTPYIAAAYFADRDPERAREIATLVTGKLPNGDPNVKWAYNLIGLLHGAEQYDKAEAAYRKALAEDGGFKEAYNNLGNLYFGKGETQRAIEQFRLAIRSDDRYALAHYNLCVALYASDRSQSLLECKRACRSTDMWSRRVSSPASQPGSMNVMQSCSILMNWGAVRQRRT